MSRASLRRGHQARKQLQENAMQGLDAFCQPADVRLKAHYALTEFVFFTSLYRLRFALSSFGAESRSCHSGLHPFCCEVFAFPIKGRAHI